MSDLDQRLEALRAVLAESTVADFGDVLARHRRRARLRAASGAAAVAVVVAGAVLTTARLGSGPEREVSVPPASHRQPAPSVTQLGPPLTTTPSTPVPRGPAVSSVAATFGPDGTAWALAVARCRGADVVRCTPLVARSIDDGATWQAAGTLPPVVDGQGQVTIVAASRDDVWANVDPSSGWVVSHDAGHTWAATGIRWTVSVTSAGGTIWGLRCDASRTCTVLAGSGSGSTLTPTAQPFARYPYGSGRYAVMAAADADHALVALDGAPSYAVTADRGRSWQVRRSPCAVQEGSVAGTADGSYWLLCAGEPGAGQQPKQLYRSTDRGLTWQREPDPESSGYATELHAVNAKVAWRTGGRAPLLLTTDGGRTWRALLTDVFGDQAGGYGSNVAVRDATTAIALQGADVYRTRDGGATWQRRRLPS